MNDPTTSWTCACGHAFDRYRGQGETACPGCGQWFNAFGQRLRDDRADNPSTWDEEVSDLEGFELAHADDR